MKVDERDVAFLVVLALPLLVTVLRLATSGGLHFVTLTGEVYVGSASYVVEPTLLTGIILNAVWLPFALALWLWLRGDGK